MPTIRKYCGIDAKAAGEAHDEVENLVLFKQDMGTFQLIYTFLSQIVDYGNTAIESRYMFYKRLLPLLEFSREREDIDLSGVMLTHHILKNRGKQAMVLGDGEQPKCRRSPIPVPDQFRKKRRPCSLRLFRRSMTYSTAN